MENTICGESKQRFKHKIVETKELKETIAKEEKDGWELCAVIGGLFNPDQLFFKKPVE